MPRGKTGLNGTAWKDFPDTETARRRESATGAEARNRSMYSQITSPKSKSKTEKVIPMDFDVLTTLQRPGERKEKFISRVSSFLPLPEKGKMVKQEQEATVGKANITGIKKEEETTDVGKANEGSAAILFDKPLFHVLTHILQLKIDG